jgi:hypothetical protein
MSPPLHLIVLNGRNPFRSAVLEFKLAPIVEVWPSNKPGLGPIQSPAHRTPPLAAPAILATMQGSSAVMMLAEGPSDCRPSARSLNSRGKTL